MSERYMMSKDKIQTNLALKNNCILLSVVEKYTSSYKSEWLIYWAKQRVWLHQQDRANNENKTEEWKGHVTVTYNR